MKIRIEVRGESVRSMYRVEIDEDMADVLGEEPAIVIMLNDESPKSGKILNQDGRVGINSEAAKGMFRTITLNAITRRGICYLDELAEMSAREVLEMKMIGEMGLKEIRDALAAYAMKLKGD